MIQRGEEGCNVDGIASELTSIENCASEHDLRTLYAKLESTRPSADFPYDEPSDLEGIRNLRPHGRNRVEFEIGEEELRNKIYGAWLGRCAGCILGKPVEGWTKQKIKEYLELAHAYPLSDYLPAVTHPPPECELREEVRDSAVRGRIQFAVRDDDLDFTTLNLTIAERKGTEFTTEDIAEMWLTSMPYGLTYTAEKVTYRNLVNGISPPESATYRNPYREWIGAQIRADMWGYIAPGKPTLAAELAYRDAALSHVKNGIYGEMFCAAMISASFATDRIDEIIDAGLAEIPEKSRLTEAVMDVIKWKAECSTWEEAWLKIMTKYGSYSPMHTINNAALVLLGLLYSSTQLGEGISISVMSGLDADCNGATCGSIIGAIIGSRELPQKWTDPFNDKLQTAVSGFSDCRISDLAQRTFLIARKAI